MPPSLTCPHEAELLAMAMGESVPAEVTAHLATCESCQAKLDLWEAEVALLRANRPQVSSSSSTVSGPMSHLNATNIHVDLTEGTILWELPRLAARPEPEPRTDLLDHAASWSGEAPLPAAIGRYLVVGRFPPSGQAEVFRVVHPQFHQERVLKLARQPVGPDGRSEIAEEGKILAELEHPHLVRVYDLEFQGDRPFLVMEYVRGRNLEQCASETPSLPAGLRRWWRRWRARPLPISGESSTGTSSPGISWSTSVASPG